MKHLLPLLLLLAVGAAGCQKAAPPPVLDDSPLTLEEWKKLPSDIKYEQFTVDRLRGSDPKLKNERAWNKFLGEHVGAELRRETLPAKN